MLQIYTGNGKGKTTAALGLAMRACGHGMSVGIIQFMKGSTYSGELVSAVKLGIDIFQFGRTCPHAAVIKSGFMRCQKCGGCWIGLKSVTELDKEKIRMAWKLAEECVRDERYQLLILDEIMSACKYELLSVKEVEAWLKNIPDSIEIVLTGRNAPEEFIALADLVSEVRQIKHPYEKGIESRRGIEY